MLRLACAAGLRHLARMHMTSRVGAEPGSYSAAPVRLESERPRPAFAQRAVGAVVLLVIVMHVVVNLVTPYEVHRDEFLYMAMGQHLRLWRMDFPPGIALVSLLERGLLGDSLAAIRFLPAVASGAVALVAALVARELGGRRFAQWSAALLAVVSPFALRSGGLFQPVVFDTLWWTLGLYALVRLCADESDAAVRTWWIAYGVACGIGLLFKFSILFFGAATFAALLATRRRRDLLTPWPWVAFLITIALGSPSIVGQLRLGYPVVGQMATLQRTQLVHVGLADFVVAQPMLIGVGLLLAIPGAIALVVTERWRAFRLVGWTCVLAFLLLLALRGKAYYIGPIYPTLIAAGAVLLCDLPRAPFGVALRWGVIAAAAAFTIVAFPVALPVLAPEALERYMQRIGAQGTNRNNRGGMERLPQDFADMLTWNEQADAVAHVFHALPPDEQRRTVIIGDNYGEAGALDFYGPRLGLPPAVSAAGSYWFFGPGGRPGEIAIVLGGDRESLLRFFDDVRPEVRVLRPYGPEGEYEVMVWLCRRPKTTLHAIWPSLAGQN